MPVLPLIDLMILIAWTSLILAGSEKLIGVAMNSRPPQILGLGPFDFVVVAGVALLFALALAARVWVRAAEPSLLRARREARGAGPREVVPDVPEPQSVRRI